MTIAIFIDGAVGTTGLEIRERLSGRADVSVLDEARRKDAAARRDALNDADLVVLCLPDDAAREAVAMIDNRRTRVVDASTAHRVAEEWTYGFAELEPGRGDEIAAARLVSNPGCYPTGFLALVRPLVRAGLLPADALLSVNAASGYSGGGKSMIAEFENGHADTAFRPYALTLAHKHAPEMTRHAGLAHAPIFQPAVANTYRGMVVEVPLHQSQLVPGTSVEAVAATLRDAYADAALRLVATLDNLGKGAAGAAVQNVNLMAGLDPLAGLTR
jgi:N-acetyl-gamma-glutamyl-phosphate reductase